MSEVRKIEVKWNSATDLFCELLARDHYARKTPLEYAAAGVPSQGDAVNISLEDAMGVEIQSPLAMKVILTPTPAT